MITQPWLHPIEEVLHALQVESTTGLGPGEVKSREIQHGRNLLREIKLKSAWRILLDQFKNLIILLLGAAAALSYFFGEWLEGTAIVAVIFINTAVGFATEFKAVRSMEAMRRLGSVKTRVRRNGRVMEVPADTLVPGDIVLVEGGDVVTADLRLIQASRLQADESALTGESLPVVKGTSTLKAESSLVERANMLFKGTAVTRGSGEGVVVATGMATELGRISSLVSEAHDETTPLEKRLDQLGHRLIWVTLAITAVVGVLGFFRGRALFITLETSIALAVAAIPEGLPIVATIALARGMRRMARRNALINRLSSVETLGATTVIFTDKTGTLTENRMAVSRLVVDAGEIQMSAEEGLTLAGRPVRPEDHPTVQSALLAAVICNNASYEEKDANGETHGTGDPLEIALLKAGMLTGIRRKAMLEILPEVREEAFDAESKMMATFHKDRDGFLVAVKGAPEEVFSVSNRLLTDGGERPFNENARQDWTALTERLAGQGLRVLALAQKKESSAEAPAYEDLTLIGLIGLLDPPRPDIRDALDCTRKAGIRTVMVTGDQALTARNIAAAVGLTQNEDDVVVQGKDLKAPESICEEERRRLARVPIFARVSPQQKLDLISIYQGAGEVVAMTGDGVNDAPALKKADIGIAMGLRGTQVAREAADMVLKDDSFASIVAAVAQGRVIFGNIRKFVVYLISCNISEVASVALASAANLPFPLLPLQILFLNLVTDVFPALALGVGEGSPAVMTRGPRPPEEPIVTRRHCVAMGGYGLLITAAVFGALFAALHVLGLEEEQSVSISFLTIASAQLWHVFNMSHRGAGFLRNDVSRNPYVWIALGLCFLLLMCAVFIPLFAEILHLTTLTKEGWALILVMSLFPLITGRILKRILGI
jgi:Ca2+-transporting ATPase